jgi:hypothetical protein
MAQLVEWLQQVVRRRCTPGNAWRFQCLQLDEFSWSRDRVSPIATAESIPMDGSATAESIPMDGSARQSLKGAAELESIEQVQGFNVEMSFEAFQFHRSFCTIMIFVLITVLFSVYTAILGFMYKREKLSYEGGDLWILEGCRLGIILVLIISRSLANSRAADVLRAQRL